MSLEFVWDADNSSGAVAHCMARASDSQLREPGVESWSAVCLTLGNYS